MKGLIFLEFLFMVEETFSPEMVEQIIDMSDLPSGGSYTSIGTYDHDEIVQLVSCLSEQSGVAVSDLLRAFGNKLFDRLVIRLPHFVEESDSAFDFLTKVHDVIHVEVLKLYPDATLPVFEYNVSDHDRLIMRYISPRPFEDLAQGLIEGCIHYFDEKIDLHRETITDAPEKCVNFILTRENLHHG